MTWGRRSGKRRRSQVPCAAVSLTNEVAPASASTTLVSAMGRKHNLGLWLPPSRCVTTPRAVAMSRRAVTMGRMTMPVRRGCKLLPHQRAAAAVPHDLPVGHAVARANGATREMRGGDRLVAPVTIMRAAVMRPRGARMRPARVMVAGVDPAVAWARSRHWREGWRNRLGLRRRRRRYLFRCRLLDRNRQLLPRRLLRAHGR
jgi:hypothetical protein